MYAYDSNDIYVLRNPWEYNTCILNKSICSNYSAWSHLHLSFYTNVMASRQRKAKLQQTIAARIKSLRLTAGLTQEQLSEKAGIAPHYLSRLENARQVPSLNTIIDVAEGLGTSPCVLLAEPQEDTQLELISRVTAVLSGLSKDDAEFLELQFAAWASRLKKRK
jgi:transcriptional regulator with XRE-family HTH domain